MLVLFSRILFIWKGHIVMLLLFSFGDGTIWNYISYFILSSDTIIYCIVIPGKPTCGYIEPPPAGNQMIGNSIQMRRL